MSNDTKDSFYDPEQPPVSEIWQIPLPKGRFNNWGERKWVTVTPEETSEVDRELMSLQLSPRAGLLFRAAKLTKSSGVEFVLFSDAQFPGPVIYKDNGMHIVPCFKPLMLVHGADASDRRQATMMKRGKFIYDGWIPIDNWNPSKFESVVESLDDFVNLFSLVGRYHAYWEPKYDYRSSAVPSHLVIPEDFNSLARTSFILDSLPENDKRAISRSSAWITNALKDDSLVQRFLLLFVSIESLVNYIERQSSSKSPLHRFAKEKLTKSERRENREKCIAEVLSSDLEPTKAIQEAYFHCVVGSKALLEEHLNRIFGNDQASKAIFTEKIEHKTLWQLRNDIAHGSLNILSDQEIAFLSSRVGLLEEIARTYLQIILTSLAGVNFFPRIRQPMFAIPASQAVGTPGSDYMGPTDMADYYVNVEGLSSSFIRISGETGTSNLQFKI